ncbi:ABC transporter ATP-binding protein [Scatolibacter rhodanostii]|uniref:ABC transporter ATP-binding protein n=1 Tax=Scatolibacter rhodanostii TaxID=2014781 RepID=UPI000C07253F|nr:ABC transporter ATP-binding protein [Scatolibacter rhodanostii]
MKKLLRFIKPWRVPFVLGWMFKFFEAILELLLPIFMKEILNKGIPNQDKDYTFSMLWMIMLVSIAGLIFALICQYVASKTSQGVGAEIRSEMMRKISTFSYRELDQFGSSTLINRITGDVNNVQQAIAMTIRLVSRAPFLCIGSILLSFTIDPLLSLVFVILMPILGLLLYFFTTHTSKLYRAAQKKLDNLGVVIKENLSGVRVIRAFARWNTEKKRCDDTTEELSDAYIHVSRLAALSNPVTSILMNFGIIVILYLGGQAVNGGRLQNGDILALSTYATQLLLALVIVVNLIVLFTKAAASSVRINEILDTVPSLSFPEEPVAVSRDSKNIIEFQHVSFSYNGTEPALTDLDFSVKKGESLGVVGITGSGKTSLINLLQRFYDPNEGSVLLYGEDVRRYSQKQLRSLIGIVPQHSILFSGSIADNLRWGNAEATEEEMWQALETAQAKDFVENLPQTLDFVIQEGGKNFSGGQRQRLAIARALIKKPDILIMDDSLSALDFRTDLLLRQALKHNLPNTTLLVVSQRISSVADAKKIILLDDGEIGAIGTHQDLFENSEIYREIYQSQTQMKGKEA